MAPAYHRNYSSDENAAKQLQRGAFQPELDTKSSGVRGSLV